MKGAGQPGGRDRWLLSFADLMTLLFAFTLVLYVATAFDEAEQAAVHDGLRSSFGGEAPGPAALEQLAEALGPELERLLVLDVLALEQDERALRIVIQSRKLFEPGAILLNPHYDALLETLAARLREQPVRVAVEGHTDQTPLSGSSFPSNLSLSAARAAAVGERLLSLGMEKSRISVAGFGAERPAASNATVEGRGLNRRIVLRVIPEAYLDAL